MATACRQGSKGASCLLHTLDSYFSWDCCHSGSANGVALACRQGRHEVCSGRPPRGLRLLPRKGCAPLGIGLQAGPSLCVAGDKVRLGDCAASREAQKGPICGRQNQLDLRPGAVPPR